MSSNLYSYVELLSGNRPNHQCGYCKARGETSYSYGMWAHQLTVEDYQTLIDRGWRRSGKYCYKPSMRETCCPQYTIRCDVLDFKLSRSHKKVLKRMHNFLARGVGKNQKDQQSSMDGGSESYSASDSHFSQMMPRSKPIQENLSLAAMFPEDLSPENTQAASSPVIVPHQESTENTAKSSQTSLPKSSQESEHSIDPDRPPCKKAKILRRERRLQKLRQKAATEEAAKDIEKITIDKKGSEAKSLEDFLTQPLPENPAHKLEIRTVASNAPQDPDFQATFKQSYGIYRHYQVAIHKDPPKKCSEKQFTRFLVNSPLQKEFCEELDRPYGSYHQQYWLDGKLIAVGVIDILPRCVSSVYLFYDPDYSFLSLGTYASLREIAFVRELQRHKRDLKYYYMGFYIHSCPKMRYKGQYYPSHLLCPEVYTWHPIEKCLPKLDVSKYSRLEEDATKVDEDSNVNLGLVKVYYYGHVMPYEMYCRAKRNANDQDEVKEYAQLVGNKCARNILLDRE